jgi:6-phosphogluconolactonase
VDAQAGNGAGTYGQTFAYVGSFTSSGGKGITVAAVEADGGLTYLGGLESVADPSFLALSDDASTLYCVSEAEEGAVAAFALRTPENPELLAQVSARGSGPTHLSLALGGKALLTANYGSGSISVLPVLYGADSARGGLGAVADVVDHHGTGPDRARQERAHAHQVLPDPSGRWVLAVDLGTDTVYVYALSPSDLHLRPHASLRLRGGIGPRHLVFHPSGHYFYVVDELEPFVTVCRWEADSGRLCEVGEARLVPVGATGPDYATNGVVSPDGRFLHVAVRGSDILAGFSIDDSGEVLTPIPSVDCGGNWPRHLAADPSGTRLYVSNERSGEVVWFEVDQESGVPAQAGSLPVPAASCVVFGSC